MPKIYSDEKRLEIKTRLMDVGLELIKQYGLKKLSIAELTQKVGIAQGTFYNFFDSKEMLVYSLAARYKEKINAGVRQLLQAKGYLHREDFFALYRSMMLEDEDNVYRYLKREDMQVLLSRLPSECFIRMTDIKAEIEQNLSFAREKKQNYDLDAVINWIQVMNLTLENKDLLIEPGIEKIIRQLIENMLDEVFENQTESCEP
jgi:AcrR family transcriptional regulator